MLLDADFGGRQNFFRSDDDDGKGPDQPNANSNEANDDLTKQNQSEPNDADGQSWPVRIDSAALFDEIRAAFNGHAVLCPYGDVACTMWVVHTYCFKIFGHTPRLFICSPTPACGKTTLLELLERLVNQPLATSDVTGAALLRHIQDMERTILIDEHDSMAYGDSLRNLFNSGFQSGKKTFRIDGVYETFAPLALASTMFLQPAMMSRCIVIRLRRKLVSEIVKPIRDFDGTNLKLKLIRWAQDNRDALRQARPSFPNGLSDRLENAWLPLLACADRTDRNWPKLIREAAVALSLRYEPPSKAERLLADIKEIFGADEALFSVDLVRRLVAKADAPWAGEGLNEWTLAQGLAPFGIQPKKMRLGNENRRGYRREAFLEAWARWQIEGG